MTRVIKIGGRVQEDPRLAGAIAAAASAEPGTLCIVHGGGEEVSALQRLLGMEPRFSGGRRVTTAREMELVRMVLSGSANKRLVAALLSAGVRAVGLSGEDGGLIAARPSVDPSLGFVGAPERVNVSLLWHLMDGGYVPVVSPVSRDRTAADGRPLNVNGDDAAAALAIAMSASELLFLADVHGVLVDGAIRDTLDAEQAQELIAGGTAVGGMAAKLQAGLAALEGGVERVRIGALASLHDARLGTSLLPARSFA